MNVTLAELERYDPRASRSGINSRFLCCLSDSCKHHTGQEHRSLSVNIDTGWFYCHRCKKKGRLSDVEYSQQKETVTKMQRAAASSDPPDIKIRKMFAFFQINFFNFVPEIEAYLKGRGFPLELAIDAGAGFADEFRHYEKIDGEVQVKGTDRRLIFPIYDARAQVVSYFARALDDKNFIDSAKMFRGDRDKGVFYVDETDLTTTPTVAICEGVFDALALKLAGIPAIALNGTHVQNWLLFRLARRNIVIATDSDSAGERVANDLLIRVHPFLSKAVRMRFSRNDVAEILEKDGLEALKSLVSETVSQFN